jgi:hypothetical protein
MAFFRLLRTKEKPPGIHARQHPGGRSIRCGNGVQFPIRPAIARQSDVDGH